MGFLGIQAGAQCWPSIVNHHPGKLKLLTWISVCHISLHYCKSISITVWRLIEWHTPER